MSRKKCDATVCREHRPCRRLARYRFAREVRGGLEVAALCTFHGHDYDDYWDNQGWRKDADGVWRSPRSIPAGVGPGLA